MKHKGKEWFHPNVTRSQAEDMLRRVPVDGAFLVRPSGANTYALSFRFVMLPFFSPPMLFIIKYK